MSCIKVRKRKIMVANSRKGRPRAINHLLLDTLLFTD